MLCIFKTMTEIFNGYNALLRYTELLISKVKGHISDRPHKSIHFQQWKYLMVIQIYPYRCNIFSYCSCSVDHDLIWINNCTWHPRYIRINKSLSGVSLPACSFQSPKQSCNFQYYLWKWQDSSHNIQLNPMTILIFCWFFVLFFSFFSTPQF